MSGVPGYFSSPSATTGGFPYAYGAQGSEKFPNPFFDIASTFVPTELNTVLEMAEYIYTTFGTWRTASRRVIRYFLTEIILEGSESQDERDKFKKFLSEDLHLLSELAAIGDEFSAYGNVFVSVFLPFDRFLVSPAGIEYKVDQIDYKFDPSDCSFHGYCKKAGKDVKFEIIDRRSPDKKRVRIKRWNPKEMQLRYHPVSAKTEYYWEIPPRFTKKILEGDKFYLNDTPMGILQCVCGGKGGGGSGGGNRPLFKFEDDAIYHYHESTLSGLPVIGWGIPPILANFKLAYYIQVLRRFDEAVALDFIMPFRVIYPDYGPSASQDPLKIHNMSVFRGMMQAMVQEHRKDPTRIQISPYKIGYQMLGGEGKTLTPKEQLAMATDELLNALGYPAELYRGTLSIQAFPVALRLFERTWGGLVDANNDLLRWIFTLITKYYGWGDITGHLRSVTLADDIERKALSLQAAAGMDISKTTAYLPLGLDYMEEQKRIMEEQTAIQRLQQEQMGDQMAQQGLEGTGAQPAVGATPGDVYQQAQALAQQLLFQVPDTLRRGELIKIKQSNPTLHALVLQSMDEMRQELGRQGGAAAMEQAKASAGAGGGMVAQASSGLVKRGLTVDDLDGINRLVIEGVLLMAGNDLRKIAHQVKNAQANDGSDPARMAFHFVYRKLYSWPVSMKRSA